MTNEEAIKFLKYLKEWLKDIANDDILKALDIAINDLIKTDLTK